MCTRRANSWAFAGALLFAFVGGSASAQLDQKYAHLLQYLRTEPSSLIASALGWIGLEDVSARGRTLRGHRVSRGVRQPRIACRRAARRGEAVQVFPRRGDNRRDLRPGERRFLDEQSALSLQDLHPGSDQERRQCAGGDGLFRARGQRRGWGRLLARARRQDAVGYCRRHHCDSADGSRNITRSPPGDGSSGWWQAFPAPARRCLSRSRARAGSA